MTQLSRSSALRAGLALALASAVAAPALAGVPVDLKDPLTDATGHVTLGELFDHAGAASQVVVAERRGPSVVLDAAAVQAFARRYGLDWPNARGIARIIVRGQSGAAAGDVEVLTYAHDIAAGEIVQPSDLVWSKAAGDPPGAPAGAQAVVGMAARRPLRGGAPVLAADVTTPIAIKIGDAILVTYADGGVTLTLQAKAMGSAAVGETVNALNPISKRTIEVVATGPDQAVVGPAALRLRAQNESNLIALR